MSSVQQQQKSQDIQKNRRVWAIQRKKKDKSTESILEKDPVIDLLAKEFKATVLIKNA